jgi:hypothetical protein
MTMERTIYHVVPIGEDWVVRREGQRHLGLHIHDTKSFAIRFAQHLADTTRPSLVKLHNRAGMLEAEWKYGDDLQEAS